MTTPPELRFAFVARVDIAPAERIGHGDGEELWFTPITGGTIEGPRLNGTVVGGGGDRTTTRRTATELDARYLIRADDGALIDIVNRGFWVADPAVDQAIAAGETVSADRYYFRTQPVFRTDAPAHAWLTRTVFVGVAYDDSASQQIRVEFFEVL